MHITSNSQDVDLVGRGEDIEDGEFVLDAETENSGKELVVFDGLAEQAMMNVEIQNTEVLGDNHNENVPEVARVVLLENTWGDTVEILNADGTISLLPGPSYGF